VPYALITGATGGIGRLVVSRLADRGWEIVASGRDAAILADLTGMGSVWTHDGDLTRPEAAAALAQVAERRFGSHLDCLIHCAGVAAHAPIDEATASEVQRTLAINTTFPMELTRASIPLLSRSAAPRIIFVGSILAEGAMQNTSVYAASKHAMRGYVRSLRLECGAWLRVSEVDPGAVETSFLQNTLNLKAREAFSARRLQRLPAAAVANAVTSIALEEDPNVVVERIVIVPFGQHRRASEG
jgi:NAD(P)-dependent dehydrogenase (short-subunit alcohol dehydrogenase family)